MKRHYKPPERKVLFKTINISVSVMTLFRQCSGIGNINLRVINIMLKLK